MNNFNQNNFGMNPYMMGGPQYAPQPQARMTQPLTVEQIKQLRNQTPAFTMDVSEEDMLRSRCTHKLNGKFETVFNNDAEGTVTCSICGAKFSLLEIPKESVDEAVRILIDLLQSIKTYYVNIPPNVAIEFFQMIPFIEKIPKLYEIALNDFNKYDGAGMGNQSHNMYGFNMLGAITSPMAYQMGGIPMNNGGYPNMMPMGNPFGGYQIPNNMQQGQQGMQQQGMQQQGMQQQGMQQQGMQQQGQQGQQNNQNVNDPSCVVQSKVFNV